MIRLSMMRGDTATLRVPLLDVDEAPFDVDDIDDVTFTARRWYDSAVVITKALNDGIALETDDDDDVVAVITVQPADTSDLTAWQRLTFDVEVTTAYDALTRTPVRGQLTIAPDVTT